MTTKKQKTYEPIKDLEGEIWKDIIGCEGKYQVSNKGRVKSRNFYRRKTEILIKPYACDRRYLSVQLKRYDKKNHYMIHRLVYEHFIGNLPEYDKNVASDIQLVINHKDENTFNNCVDNLELITSLENANYGTRNQRVSKSMTNGALSKKVYQYTADGNLVKVWPSTMECKRNGYNFSNVASCCRNSFGRKKNESSCMGYIWSYVPLTKEQCYEKRKKESKRKVEKNPKKVYQYTNCGELLKIWNSTQECGRNGFSQMCVSRCCRKIQKFHKGFIWSFTPLFNND